MPNFIQQRLVGKHHHKGMKMRNCGNGYWHITNGANNILKIRNMTKIALVKAIDNQNRKSGKEIGQEMIRFFHNGRKV